MSTLKTLLEFQSLECRNPINVALAFCVYQDLHKTKRYSQLDTSYLDLADLDLIYLTAFLGERLHAFIPQNGSDAWNLYDLERIQSKLKETHKDCIIHLAICDAASNVLYYSMTAGFVDKPANWHKKP